MKLWLLDADIIIDLLSIGAFDKLAELHDVYVVSTVIEEVKSFETDVGKKKIDFRREYVDTELVKEISASIKEIQDVLSMLPLLRQNALDPGELESLAVLLREEELTVCSCDAAAIRTLPFLDVSERGISAERMLRESGLGNPGRMEDKHTEEYFKNNLEIGRKEKILNF